MNEKGMFLRESFMEIPQLEMMFITPRGFLYQMNRLSDEIWQKEQLDDKSGEPPITLDTIEHSFDKKSVLSMLESEKGFKYNPSRMNDIELCNLIDNELVKQFQKTSVYDLTDTQKFKLSQMLSNDLNLPPYQIKRCLAM